MTAEKTKEEILAHCHVLYGQGKTADQAYLILVERHGNGDYCSACIVEVFLITQALTTK